MRNGTKIGLALIGIAWLSASTAISVHFVARALSGTRTHMKFTDPLVYRGRVPADARILPEAGAAAGASRLVGDAKG